MKKKIQDVLSKLKAKHYIIILAILLSGIWLIICANFQIETKYISCGSRPADIKVNYEKK